jgi:hypothetical protein
VGLDDYEESESNDDEEDDELASFYFDGKLYPSFQEMVDAKHRRNANAMARLGCLEARSAFSLANSANNRCEKSARTQIAIVENERGKGFLTGGFLTREKCPARHPQSCIQTMIFVSSARMEMEHC